MLSKLTERELLVVIQEDPPNDAMALTAIRDIPETMKVFREVHPTRIASSDPRNRRLSGTDFWRTYAAHKMVADGKEMQALGFWRN